jgi:hypothetical protein
MVSRYKLIETMKKKVSSFKSFFLLSSDLDQSKIKKYIFFFVVLKKYKIGSWMFLIIKIICFWFLYGYKDYFSCYDSTFKVPVYNTDFSYILFYFLIHIFAYFFLILYSTLVKQKYTSLYNTLFASVLNVVIRISTSFYLWFSFKLFKIILPVVTGIWYGASLIIKFKGNIVSFKPSFDHISGYLESKLGSEIVSDVTMMEKLVPLLKNSYDKSVPLKNVEAYWDYLYKTVISDYRLALLERLKQGTLNDYMIDMNIKILDIQSNQIKKTEFDVLRDDYSCLQGTHKELQEVYVALQGDMNLVSNSVVSLIKKVNSLELISVNSVDSSVWVSWTVILKFAFGFGTVCGIAILGSYYLFGPGTGPRGLSSYGGIQADPDSSGAVGLVNDLATVTTAVSGNNQEIATVATVGLATMGSVVDLSQVSEVALSATVSGLDVFKRLLVGLKEITNDHDLLKLEVRAQNELSKARVDDLYSLKEEIIKKLGVDLLSTVTPDELIIVQKFFLFLKNSKYSSLMRIMELSESDNFTDGQLKSIWKEIKKLNNLADNNQGFENSSEERKSEIAPDSRDENNG